MALGRHSCASIRHLPPEVADLSEHRCSAHVYECMGVFALLGTKRIHHQNREVEAVAPITACHHVGGCVCAFSVCFGCIMVVLCCLSDVLAGKVTTTIGMVAAVAYRHEPPPITTA